MNVNSNHTIEVKDRESEKRITASLAENAMRLCDILAGCSEDPSHLTRRYLTPAMHQVHDHLCDRMNSLGMTSHVDAAGNVIGRRAGSSKSRTLIIGSHLDTVPCAGRYDGVLGVVVGLALVEALGDQQLPFNIDVIGFSEEEGIRFGEPYLGSSAAAGCFSQDWLGLTDHDGISMREVIESFGCDSACLGECAYSAEEVIGFIEPHLEQGPVLERMEQPVGVVSAIVGQSRLTLAFNGEEGHAGTQPMVGRHDALVAASEFVGLVRRVGLEVEDLRATVGKLDLGSCAANVIPSRVELTLDIRHPSDGDRHNAVSKLINGAKAIAAQEGCEFEILRSSDQKAVKMDDTLMSHLSASVNELTGTSPVLASGAGHDAVVMAKRFPVAMLFLRHPGGISHSPKECVEAKDVASAIEVLIRTIYRLAEVEDKAI